MVTPHILMLSSQYTVSLVDHVFVVLLPSTIRSILVPLHDTQEHQALAHQIKIILDPGQIQGIQPNNQVTSPVIK